jgi:hypothetical protein
VALVQQFLDHFRAAISEPVPEPKVPAQGPVVLDDGREQHLLMVAAQGVDNISAGTLLGLNGKIEAAKGIRATVDEIAKENHDALQPGNTLGSGDCLEKGGEKLAATMNIRNGKDLLTGLGGERNGVLGDREVHGRSFWGFPDNAFTDHGSRFCKALAASCDGELGRRPSP